MPRRAVSYTAVFDHSAAAGQTYKVYGPDTFGGWTAATYTPPIVRYISPTGSDSANGLTPGTAFKTFPRARTDLAIADGGDVIYAAGLYDYANCAPAIDEQHAINTLATRRVRIMGPGVAGKLSSEMAHITNFSGNQWEGINHGAFVGDVPWVEFHGLWIDCHNTYSMGLRVQGQHHLYDTSGRFRFRGRLLRGIVVNDCLVENSRQTNMNFRGNLYQAQVTNNISRAPGQDGGFVGEGIYFGTEPRSYGDDEPMSEARSYDRFIENGGSTAGTTVLYEIDLSHDCLLSGNTIDLAYPGGVAKSECVEVKPLSGTAYAEFDVNPFQLQVYDPGTGPLIGSLTHVKDTTRAIKITNNVMTNPGRAAILIKGSAVVEGNTIGAPSTEQQACIAIGRGAYSGPETGGFVLVTGDTAWVENNTISPAHTAPCAFNGEFLPTGQQLHVCGNPGPPNPWKIWPTGPAITTDNAAGRAQPLAAFGDPRSTCV